MYDFLGRYHHAMLAYMCLYSIAPVSIFLAGKPRPYFATGADPMTSGR